MGSKWQVESVKDAPSSTDWQVQSVTDAPNMPDVLTKLRAANDAGKYDEQRDLASDTTQQNLGVAAGYLQRPFQILGGLAQGAYQGARDLSNPDSSIKQKLAGLFTSNPVTSIPAQMVDSIQQGLRGTPDAVKGSYVGQGLDNIGDPYAVGKVAGQGANDAIQMATGLQGKTAVGNPLSRAKPTIPEAVDAHSAALLNNGGVPAGANIRPVVETATPRLQAAADQMGVTAKNVTPESMVKVSEKAISTANDAFNDLVQKANPKTPVNSTVAAAKLRQMASAEEVPAVKDNLNSLADEVEAADTIEKMNGLRTRLNKETVAYHKIKNASDQATALRHEANVKAQSVVRPAVYEAVGSATNIPPEQIQAMQRGEGALIQQNDWINQANKNLADAAVADKGTTLKEGLQYGNTHTVAGGKAAVASSVASKVMGGKLGAWRSQMARFLGSERAPVVNPKVASGTVIGNKLGLKVPQVGVPSGPSGQNVMAQLQARSRVSRANYSAPGSEVPTGQPGRPVPPAGSSPAYQPEVDMSQPAAFDLIQELQNRANSNAVPSKPLRDFGPPPLYRDMPTNPSTPTRPGYGGAGIPRQPASPLPPMTPAELRRFLFGR